MQLTPTERWMQRGRYPIRLAALLGVSGALVFAVARPTLTQAQTEVSKDTVTAQVIARERAYWDAMASLSPGDADAVGTSLETSDATNFLTFSAELLDASQMDRPKWEKFCADTHHLAGHSVYGMARTHVQVYGDTAILCYRLSFMSDRLKQGTLSNITSVYVRQNGVWRRAHKHQTDITDNAMMRIDAQIRDQVGQH